MVLKSSFVTKILLSAAIAFASFYSVSAQSASEIAAARSMARSYGYSDSEIDAMMNQKGGSQSGKTQTQKTVAGVTNVTVEANEGEVIAPAPERIKSDKDIYGHDFFSSNGLSVIPSLNAPVPESYVLGPGDEVVIDIWGSTTSTIMATIGSDGSIPVEDLGPVYIAGQTVSSAEKTLKAKLSRIYSDLSGSDPGSNLRLTTGRIKGVTVNVLGEVNVPGLYTLPSLSSISSAIYMAGGVTETGSVRVIKLYRGGKQVSTFDLYEFIFEGKYDENLRLQDNDIISVEAAGKVVKIEGAVNRAMSYELKENETVKDALDYALGFKYNAVTDKIHLERISTGLGMAYDLAESQFGSFKVENGDKISVKENRVLFENRVQISGAVMYPGAYALGDGITTVGSLIEAAGGLLEDAFKDRGQINRLDEDRRRVFVAFNVADVLNGADISLVREDSIHIFSIDSISLPGNVSINGFVNRPGDFRFDAGMTLGDLIMLAGGFADGVDSSKIEVASIGYREKGEVHTYNLIENPDALGTQLKKYDVVSVRRHTYFRNPSIIHLNGEVVTPGSYVIDKVEVRLSDVIERAGGFTDEAYVKGAKLTRVLTAEEQANQRMAYEMAMKNLGNGDSIDFTFLQDWYNVGIDLEKALENPGSAADLVLREGDIISVPQMNNVVRISGGVYVPTATSFDEKFQWKDYIKAAGGFTRDARKRKTYAIYMNGKIAARGSRNFKMEPGMELVVPEKKKDDGRHMTATEVAAIASSTSSVAAMILAIMNLIK